MQCGAIYAGMIRGDSYPVQIIEVNSHVQELSVLREDYLYTSNNRLVLLEDGQDTLGEDELCPAVDA